jgi:hypothetical protein
MNKQQFYGLTPEQWNAVIIYLQSCPFKEVNTLLGSLSSVRVFDVAFEPAKPAGEVPSVAKEETPTPNE